MSITCFFIVQGTLRIALSKLVLWVKKAASTLSIIQSAVSHRLSEAECRLGSPLFERDGRQLRLAQAGISMTQTALQVIPALQRAYAGGYSCNLGREVWCGGL